MNAEQLREGAALLAAATPGPWTVDHEGQYITVRAGDTTPLMEMWANGRGKRRKDADAIAWLRTHAAELLADAGRYQHIVTAFPRTIYEQCGLGQPGPHDFVTQEMVSAAIDRRTGKRSG